MKVALLVFFIVLAPMKSFASSELVLIVHPSNENSVSSQLIHQLYLGKTTLFPDGSKATPVSQVNGNIVTKKFNNEYLGMTVEEFSHYWSKQVFIGKSSPPMAAANDSEVIRLVANNPHMIGFVERASLSPDVKVVDLMALGRTTNDAMPY